MNENFPKSDKTNELLNILIDEVRGLRKELKLISERPSDETFFVSVVMEENLTVNNVTVTGGNIANVSVDSQQTIAKIEQNLIGLNSVDGKKDVAVAFEQLMKAVVESADFASPEARQDVLDGIEALVNQASQPENERKRGVFKPVIDSIAGACSGAGGLATVWQVTGPTIRAFFGI